MKRSELKVGQVIVSTLGQKYKVEYKARGHVGLKSLATGAVWKYTSKMLERDFSYDLTIRTEWSSIRKTILEKGGK